jgi:hypothetical protein
MAEEHPFCSKGENGASTKGKWRVVKLGVNEKA